MPVTQVKANQKRILIGVIVAVVFVITNAASGVLCWRQATKAAQERADAELQTYIQEHGVDRTLTYQRLADSWNKTLADVYGDVVFFGDSITAGGLWGEYYPYLTTVNLGVVGDTVECLLTRLPQIETLMCEKCFVMIGVNNLSFQYTVEATLEKYDQLLNGLAAMSESFGMQVYVQSVLPVREDVTVYGIANQDVRTLNEGISALADKYGMTYIDIHSLMTDEEGALIENYTEDGLHLTEVGYQTWQEALVPYLDE